MFRTLWLSGVPTLLALARSRQCREIGFVSHDRSDTAFVVTPSGVSREVWARHGRLFLKLALFRMVGSGDLGGPAGPRLFLPVRWELALFRTTGSLPLVLRESTKGAPSSRPGLYSASYSYFKHQTSHFRHRLFMRVPLSTAVLHEFVERNGFRHPPKSP